MRTQGKHIAAVVCLGMLTASPALAAPNAGFSELGFIQDATKNAAPRAGVAAGFEGGTIVINGKRMVVPDNTIVQFPASAWTWAQLFDPTAWAPVYDPAITTPPVNPPAPPAGKTGLALTDPLVNHFPSYEVSVSGNIVTDFVAGTQSYIVGLITPVAQQGLNNHGGYINFIDYANGRFRVGGKIGDVNCIAGQPGGGPTCTGSLVEINDPVGRYGLIHSPDQRFSADTGNPTITAATGYPVCIPRTAPPGVDVDCPLTNRPLNGAIGSPFPLDPFLATGAPLKSFTMPSVAQVVADGPDPRRMVPLMVGDWVDVSGTIFKINPALGGNAPVNQYISAHTLTAHLGIKTAPGTKPAYVRTEGFIFGVGDRNGGPTVSAGTPPTPIAQETSTRVSLVAFTTDSNPALLIGAPGLPTASLVGVFYAPNGQIQEIPFPNGDGTNLVVDDPIRGRIRWQTSINGNTPGVLGNAAGPQKFYREYILRLSTGTTQLPTQQNGLPGLVAGQYLAPMFEYLFGEGTTFGQPIPPFNFNDLGFLSIGEGPAGPGGGAGPLKPFPAFQ